MGNLKGIKAGGKRKPIAVKTFNAGGFERIVLPNLPISKIEIVHITGSLTVSAASTSWSDGTNGGNANTVIKNVKMEYNGQTFEDWDGYVPADMEGFGAKALREYNKYQNGVAEPNERWVLDLPDALPKNLPKVLTFDWNTLANIGKGTTPTAYTGQIKIYIEIDDKVKGKVIIRKIRKNKQHVGSQIEDYFNLPKTTKGFKALDLIMHLTDNVKEDLSDAEKTYIKLNVSKGSDLIWEGRYDMLEDESDVRAQIAMSSSWAILPLGLRKFNAEEVQVKIDITTALSSTNLDIHYWLVEVAQR